jgi:pimeloyl-ACP methyl ester carboxylesterase
MRSGSAIDDYVKKVTGNNFEYYSALYNAPFVKGLPILSFHDRDDKEAGIEHARNLIKVNPDITLIETQGLGHNRILKDEEVVQQATRWLASFNVV